jgi:hypothetical protein
MLGSRFIRRSSTKIKNLSGRLKQSIHGQKVSNETPLKARHPATFVAVSGWMVGILEIWRWYHAGLGHHGEPA